MTPQRNNHLNLDHNKKLDMDYLIDFYIKRDSGAH